MLYVYFMIVGWSWIWFRLCNESKHNMRSSLRKSKNAIPKPPCLWCYQIQSEFIIKALLKKTNRSHTIKEDIIIYFWQNISKQII